jgi:hypothetical protein
LDQLRFDVLTGLGWTGLTLGHLGCCAPDCATNGDGPATGRDAATGGSGEVADEARAEPADPVEPPDPTDGADPGRSGADGADQPEPAETGDPDGANPGGPDPGGGRVIAADATLYQLLTDPRDGRLLEYGRRTFQPPQALADLIIARDVTCRFPTRPGAATGSTPKPSAPSTKPAQTGNPNMDDPPPF